MREVGIGSTTLDERERERTKALMRDPLCVFVFGSNRRGIHGAGAAAFAQRHFGARRGVGEGLVGRSYAIPTKETWRDAGLPLDEIANHVDRFLALAASRRHSQFYAVTRIGCGLAGFSDEQIAPLFRNAPPNCMLPEGWPETPQEK